MNQNDPNRNQQNPDSADQGHLPRRDRSGVQDAPEKGLREDRPEIERTADLDDLETDGQDMENVGGQGFAQGRGGNPGEVDPRFRRSAPGPSSEREERSREADVGEAAEQDADTEGKTHGSNEQDPPPTVPYGQRVEDRD
jgi:hypothetical protein